MNLFHNQDLQHYHFLWDIEYRQILKFVQQPILNSTTKNFPYECFYVKKTNMVHSFYRQGQAFNVPVSTESQPTDYQY